MADISDAQASAAKDALEGAIRDFYQKVEPDIFVTGWVLVAHKVSDDMDTDGYSAVGVVVPTGQAFPMTRGLLDVALEAERSVSS